MSRRAAAVSSIWFGIGNALQLLVSTGTFFYVARHLAPADFGLVALAAAIVDLVGTFAKFGQVEALLQVGVDDQRTRSTSFWLGMSVGLAGCLAIGATIAGILFFTGNASVALIMLLLAPLPLIQAGGQVQEAIVRARFGYRDIAIRNVLASLGSAVVAIVAIQAGAGLYSLVAQKIAYTVLLVVLMIWSARWAPSLQWAGATAAQLARTGFDVSLGNVLQMANSRIADLSIGAFLGVAALGISRIAWRIHDFVIQVLTTPISSVAVTTMTAAANASGSIRGVYLRYLQLVTLLAAPVFGLIGVAAEHVVFLLAGPRYLASAPVLSLLAAAGFAGCISLLLSPTMVATRRSKVLRYQSMLQTIVTLVLCLGAAQISLTALVVAYTARVWGFTIAGLVLSRRAADVTGREMLHRLAPGIVAAAAMIAACFGLQQLWAVESHLLAMLLLAGCAGVTYLLVLVAGDVLGVWRGLFGELIAIAREIVLPRARRAKV